MMPSQSLEFPVTTGQMPVVIGVADLTAIYWLSLEGNTMMVRDRGAKLLIQENGIFRVRNFFRKVTISEDGEVQVEKASGIVVLLGRGEKRRMMHLRLEDWPVSWLDRRARLFWVMWGAFSFALLHTLSRL